MVELGVPLRVQGGEGQVLQLLFDLLHPEPVGQRCIDVQRLLGDAPLLLARHGCDRAHVVQPVGELDDQDPQVLGHRHQHLAHRRGLLGLAGVELQSLQLGHAVHDLGDLGAERAFHVGDGDLGVLDGIVQQRSDQRDLVQTDLGDDPGHRHRVVDVALAAAAALVAVRLLGRLVGPVDHLHRRFGMSTAVGRQHRGELLRRSVGVAPPRQDAVDGGH